MMVLNLMDYTEVEMPMNVTATVRAQARGHLTGTVFMGGFLASINYAELGRDLTLEGVFELQLA